MNKKELLLTYEIVFSSIDKSNIVNSPIGVSSTELNTMAQIEPMDVDSINSEFDNKENTLHHSNVLPRTPSTEKGYEELDVSELNMKLRYSITPASSPMSKSFTANSLDNRTFDSEEYINNVIINENCNLTRSLNSTIPRNDTAKLLKSLPLQALSTELVTENRSASVLRKIDHTAKAEDNNVTITLSGQNYIDDNMSLPSTSSSVAQTPEATTPTKEIPKHDGGSPIMRGLKSVLNMFRSSQSPIPPAEVNSNIKQEILSPNEPALNDDGSQSQLAMASTPVSNKRREVSGSQRSSPLKESIVFNDDLERELQWKDETTILFKEEKIPIHKLLLPQSVSCISKPAMNYSISSKMEKENFDISVEHMDTSNNDSFLDIEGTEPVQTACQGKTNEPLMIESDGEFVDCETTINNDISDNKITENLNLCSNNQSILLQQQNILEVNIEQSTNSNQSNILENCDLKSNCDKNEISAVNNKEFNIEDRQVVDKSLEIVPNDAVASLRDNNNEVIIHNIEENCNVYSITQFKEIDLKDKNSLDNILATNITLCEDGVTQNYIRGEVTKDLKLPTDIPLPDEDDMENILNFENIYPSNISNSVHQINYESMCTVDQQEFNVTPENEINMSIDNNEVTIIKEDYSQSMNEEIKKFNIDCIEKGVGKIESLNQIVKKENNVNANIVGFINNKGSINAKETVQILQSTGYEKQEEELSTQIKEIATEKTYSVTQSTEKLYDQTTTDSLELNHENQVEIGTITDILKDDGDITHNENDNISAIENYDKSIVTEYPKENAMINNTSIVSIESLEQARKTMSVSENKSSEILENFECVSYSQNDEFSSNFIKEKTIDGEASDTLHVNLSEDFSKSVTEHHTNTMIQPKNLTIDTSKNNDFIEKENNFSELNKDISGTDVESHEMEKKLQSQCSHSDKTINVKINNTAPSNFEITCDTINSIGINSVNMNMLDLDNNEKVCIKKQENEETKQINEVINTKEENSLSKKIGSDKSSNINIHHSTANPPFNKNICQENVIENIEIEVKPSEIDHGTHIMRTDVCEKHNEILENNNPNSLICSESSDLMFNKANVIVFNSVFDHCVTVDSTNSATIEKCDIEKEENNTPNHIPLIKDDQTLCIPDLFKSENNIKTIILPHSSAQNNSDNDMTDLNLTSVNDITKKKIHNDYMSTVANCSTEVDYEIKNNETKQGREIIDTSSNNLEIGSAKLNDNVKSENVDESLEISKAVGEILAMEIKSQVAPPVSPIISSKGYNFNFDEIDDPFATKTKVRLSPPPEDSPGSHDKDVNRIKYGNNKNKIQSRKSLPGQMRQASTKNKLNSTFSDAVDYKEIIKHTKTTEDMVAIIDKDSVLVNTKSNDFQVVENPDHVYPSNLVQTEAIVKTMDIDPCHTEENAKDIKLTNSENITMAEVQHKIIDTLSDAVEIRSNVSEQDMRPVEKFEPKNVFNLPEMSTDISFNPFVTKSKLCRSPSPPLEVFENKIDFKVPACLNDCESQSVNTTNSDGKTVEDVGKLYNGNIVDHESSIASSSSKATEDATIREINTEDEDTVEGPFFEADDLNDDDKMSDHVADTENMLDFNDFLEQRTDDNVNNDEMFIDAEAFEFLLNQNKSNVVVDSGKESLFLKFDPLFAKRMSSDGVLAAFNKVQKRQSTPKRISKAPIIDVTYCDKMSTGTLNSTTEVNNTLENNFEDPNTTISKPMMVVNPAINSIISPRNKYVATPPRINRRSLTFASPAIAVIDRLLSLSGNNSTLNHEATPEQVRREHNETDLALTQLRELLAEKEIHVHNLRLESKDLKERLSILENQVQSLESEGEQRLRKVNELNERLVEKTNINKSMAAVVEEYERTIASLIAETEQDKKRHAEERMRLINERDEQTAHLSSMEISFNDLHSKYEKSKQIILTCKANEDTYRRSIKEFEESLLKMQKNYELLKQHATTKLNHANQELERLNRAHEAEVLKLNAMIKRKELHITSLEETLAQKTKANEELTAICDELINKVG